MAIDTLNFHRRPGLAVQLAVAMAILFKVAIHAMHALLQMDVFQVYSFVKFFRIVEFDGLVFFVKPRALLVVFINSAIHPAMAIEIGELGLFEFRIQVREILQKLRIGPFAFKRRCFGIPGERLSNLFWFPLLGLFRIHVLPVGFVIPPHVTEILKCIRRAGMHVAYGALAGWNGAGQTVRNWVP